MITILIKTHFGDVRRVKNLLNSIIYTKTKLPICLVSDAVTLKSLEEYKRKINLIRLIDESSILTKEELKLSGYEQQQIVKLKFYKICDTEYYFCMDSDALLFERIGEEDFIDANGCLKDFLLIDSSIELDPFWLERFGKTRANYLDKIKKFFGLATFPTAHGFVSISRSIMRDFECYLNKRGESFKSIIELSPMEFSWYFGFIKFTGIRLFPSVSPFYTLHTPKEFTNIKTPIVHDELIKKYKGIVLNSNWADDLGIFKLEDSMPVKYYLKFWFRRFVKYRLNFSS